MSVAPFMSIPLFTFLVYLGTVFEFPIPGTTIMQTGQTIAVLCAGALLGARQGMSVVLLYIGLGVAGLPIFSEGASGPAVLGGASGGYLVGFILGAGCLGWWSRQNRGRGFVGAVLGMLLGHTLILACGWLWMSHLYGGEAAYANGVAPFYLGSLVKSVLAAILVALLLPFTERMRGLAIGG